MDEKQIRTSPFWETFIDIYITICPEMYGKLRTHHTKSAIIGYGSVTHVRMDHETEK